MDDTYTWREHIIRSYDVMVLGIVYLIFGLMSSYIINYFSPTEYKDKDIQLIFEIGLEVAITVLFSYFIHIIVERLPLPMLGSKEIKESVIKEVRGGIVIAFAMFILQIKLRHKIQYLFFGKIVD